MSLQQGLDFARLDSVSAQFYLLVHPAQALQLAIRTPPRQISRAVKLCTWHSTQEVGDKSLRSQLRAIEITIRHSNAADQ